MLLKKLINRRVNSKTNSRKNSDVLRDHIFQFCLKTEATPLMHPRATPLSTDPSSCLPVARLRAWRSDKGRHHNVAHYVGISRKKRKERPLGRERWWLIFVQTRLQTVWRERFRTIFKVTSGKKAFTAKKSRVARRWRASSP